MPNCPRCGATNKEERETCWNCWAKISDLARITGTPAAKAQVWVKPKTKEIVPKVIVPPRMPPPPVKGHFNFPTRAKKEETSNDNVTCPYCSATNSATRNLCWSCWQPLTEPVESTSTTASTNLTTPPILEVTLEQLPVAAEPINVLPEEFASVAPQQAIIEVQPAPPIVLLQIFELPVDEPEPIKLITEPELAIELSQVYELPFEVLRPTEYITEPEPPVELVHFFELPVDEPQLIELISEPELQDELPSEATLPEEILPSTPPSVIIIPAIAVTPLPSLELVIIADDVPIIVAEEEKLATTPIVAAPSAPKARISVKKNYSPASWYGLLSVTIIALTLSAMLCWRLWLQSRIDVVRITRLTQTYLSSLEHGDINTQMKLATAVTKGKRLPAWITLGSSTLLEPTNMQGDMVTYAVKLYLIPAEGRSERIPALQKALSRQYQVDLVLRQEAGSWLIDQRKLTDDVKKCLTEENPGTDFPAW